ncbi:hypothetical protein [Enterovibrio calviensis]|uniref:hypothetical protein n=1 Tax=Enterovibrio calviensis TaxID=91359 RepID=UPI0037358897
MSQAANFEEYDTSVKAVGILGASLGAFAARNLANVALTMVSKPLVEAGWNAVFGSTEGGSSEYMSQNQTAVKTTTGDLYATSITEDMNKKLQGAYDNLNESLVYYKAAMDETVASQKATLLKKALDNCYTAMTSFDDHSIWVATYYTATSQYAFIAKGVLLFQVENPDIETIVPLSLVKARLNSAINHVSNDKIRQEIFSTVTAKFGDVEEKGKHYPYGFTYSYDGYNNFMRNGSHDAVLNVRNSLLSTALDLAKSQIDQPDVVQTWKLIIQELTVNEVRYAS